MKPIPRYFWIMFERDEGEDPEMTVASAWPKNKYSAAYIQVVGTEEMIPMGDPRIKGMGPEIPLPK